MNSKRCTCDKCECDLKTAHDKEKEILQIHDFLSSLDDSIHGVIQSQICAITPLLDLDSVYQTIVQNKTIRSNVTLEALVMSFASYTNSNSFNKSGTIFTRDVSRQDETRTFRAGTCNFDPSRQCTFCGRTDHEGKSCFKVLDFPEWWGDRPQNRGDNRGSPPPPTRRDRGFQP